jgi:hypothetical protein
MNFVVTFKNKFEKGDWEFILKVGATIVIEPIKLFLLTLHFVKFHSITKFMHIDNLKLKTLEMVVTSIYMQLTNHSSLHN